jgi:excinuclease ABC subunit A
MIKIINAYENNLKNISTNIPKNKITSVIGVSGSGKSTLIYDILANEAKRREKIDSGEASCYDYAIRPKFESIENLPYCITLKQRGLQQSISSTLATITKLHSLIREEFVKYGKICNHRKKVITEPTPLQIKEFIQTYYPKEKFTYYAVVCFKKKTDGKVELNVLNKNNIKEAIFISSLDKQEKLKQVASVKNLNKTLKHTILVPFRNLDSIEELEDIALESFLIKSKKYIFNFNLDYPDLTTGKIFQKKSIQLLSFNSTNHLSGKCEECNGHGEIEDIDLETLILNDKNLDESFLNLEDNGKGAYKYVNIRPSSLQKILKKENIALNQTYNNLTLNEQLILNNEIFPKILKHQGKASISKFIHRVKCPVCKGSRLNYKANAVKLYGVSISEILEFTVDKLYIFLVNKTLQNEKILIILKSIQKATLGYLSLDRTTSTLSGGELQRLKFAIELNSDYKDLIYILDEPSTGLHPYNNNQMIRLIKNLCDKGNTVLISEHNTDYINSSDHIIELGYGAGEDGGDIIFEGKNKTFDEITFLRKKLDTNLKDAIILKGVNSNNIINEDFIIPLNCLVAISGISGSGKSSLIHKVLVPTIEQFIFDKTFNKNIVKAVENMDSIQSIVELTQSQIGLNSRSIVATYLGIFDKIRDTYASLEIAKEFKFDKSYFSFNSTLGACETCSGTGELDEIICPNCLGKRYKAEVLDIKNKELNIIELLSLQINKLESIFDDKKLIFAIQTLEKLGLSHISLGRTTPTLSGGEAQRLKLAKTLIESFHKIKKGNFLFILDEPTTGLNEKDTSKIYAIFDEILSFNNSIIVIEHNQELIKNSDFIIDIGIGSGKDGGKNLFSGNFNDLLKHQTSLTAKAFNKEFEDIEDVKINQEELSSKIFTDNNIPNCNKFYLNENHFKIEKIFSETYKVQTDNKNHKYFKNKNDLFSFYKNFKSGTISFNPYVSELFKYKIIPISIKKEKIKHLIKLGFKVKVNDYKINEWDYRVPTDNIEKAYAFGNGWVSIHTKNINYELFTRLVSINNKIIGTPNIDEKTFNLYLNSCIYCKGTDSQPTYNINSIIQNKNKSITDEGFFYENIKFSLKSIINKFEKEGLFDFTKPFNNLSEEDKNIFLFGFKEYKFLKPKGRPHAITDYFRWQGIYAYVSNDVKKIETLNNTKLVKLTQKCPFCSNGFKNEILCYKDIHEKTILTYLEN